MSFSFFDGSYIRLEGATRISADLSKLEEEMALIDGNIKKHLKAQIGECNRELIELTNQLEEVHISLNIVNKIKTCYDAVEEGNNCISAGRLPIFYSYGFTLESENTSPFIMLLQSTGLTQ